MNWIDGCTLGGKQIHLVPAKITHDGISRYLVFALSLRRTYFVFAATPSHIPPLPFVSLNYLSRHFLLSSSTSLQPNFDKQKLPLFHRIALTALWCLCS